jgi:hypothetical protein
MTDEGQQRWQPANEKTVADDFRSGSGLEIILRPFLDMDSSVWHHAIAWMARDENDHQCLLDVPSLFRQVEEKANIKKRSWLNIHMVNNFISVRRKFLCFKFTLTAQCSYRRYLLGTTNTISFHN